MLEQIEDAGVRTSIPYNYENAIFNFNFKENFLKRITLSLERVV